MQKILSFARTLPAVVFLTYALVANLAVLERDWFRPPPENGGWLNGDVTVAFGDQYEQSLPHRPLAQGWLGAARYLLAGEGREGVLVGRDGWLFTSEETRLADPQQILRAVDHVSMIDRQLSAAGSHLVVVVLPAKLDIARAAVVGALPVEDMATQYATFVAALSERGISVVDTRPALVAANDENEPVFLRTDTHWSPHGAASVAEAVAASGFIPLGASTFRRVAATPVVFAGDLVSFVTTDPIASRLGLVPETVVPWVAEDTSPAAAGIFATDAPDPDLVLIGTSYSANASWSFGPALTLVLRRPLINLAEQGLGPIRTMAAFVAADSFTQAAPATVIWEFPVRYLADPGIWPDVTPIMALASSGAPSHD
ncbi:alginate O-acetyltransferase AlgX-related protein [Roseicyclus marinus]|uniref:alginate O-acetyltransferase AlgX-related protein n=1 Tax=Roseicyclus marinus TaxID=2161673 RepID=UPI00240F7A87|nr:hypothetical protein [Roseicyclus marinus]MDG3042776.1 hypothetical protein [Roseicyclus marinus]